MIFRGSDHQRLFVQEMKRHSDASDLFTAVLYLLTADNELWRQTQDRVSTRDIDLTGLKVHGLTEQSYVFYCAAKDMLNGSNMRKPINVLSSLREHSSDKSYTYERLYRNLYNRDLFLLAYQNIYAAQGNMTQGADGKTIDAMSLNRIDGIIASLKDESYQPQPSRRVYIPKKNGKMRPLGIPSFDDKLVQECVRLLLESVYEGSFANTSHGFRPNRSCHTALSQVQVCFTGVKWFVEGDIKGFFDNIDHEVMVNIVAERIKDERFLRLIRKFLRAGYLEDWKYHNSYSGTPQGGIISPILANIYLDKLDRHIE